jgi:hypothetical protein
MICHHPHPFPAYGKQSVYLSSEFLQQFINFSGQLPTPVMPLLIYFAKFAPAETAAT